MEMIGQISTDDGSQDSISKAENSNVNINSIKFMNSLLVNINHRKSFKQKSISITIRPRTLYNTSKLVLSLPSRRQTNKFNRYHIRSLHSFALNITNNKKTNCSINIMHVLKLNTIQKRFMWAYKGPKILDYLAHTPRTNPTFFLRNPNNLQNTRTMAAVHGGKLRSAAQALKDPISASENTPAITSDLSGFHKIAVVTVCNHSDCKVNNCATGTTITNPCKVSSEIHNQPLKENINQKFQYEFSGSITHNVPPTLEGVLLSETDMNNNKDPQYLVKEKGTIPIKVSDLKENEATTTYLQANDITQRVLTAMPESSILNISHSNINTPLDYEK